MVSFKTYILIAIIGLLYLYLLNYKTKENFQSYKENGYFKDWFDWDENVRLPWKSQKCVKNYIQKWYWY